MTKKRIIIPATISAVFGMAALIVLSTHIINDNNRYILLSTTERREKVGIVLGAGVAPNGKPYKELQARLEVAAQGLKDGQVEKLILSGDNRDLSYNEPAAMKRYLVDVKGIDPTKLQPDYAGRSTYESCERASKVFNLQSTILYSAESHLPRAIYLCRHFGVEAYGVASGVEANNSGRREPLARVKAVINVYVGGQSTVLGNQIKL